MIDGTSLPVLVVREDVIDPDISLFVVPGGSLSPLYLSVRLELDVDRVGAVKYSMRRRLKLRQSQNQTFAL